MADQCDERWMVAQALKTYGGSFAQALGEALLRADEDNTQRIRDAFPELWKGYLNHALTIRSRALGTLTHNAAVAQSD